MSGPPVYQHGLFDLILAPLRITGQILSRAVLITMILIRFCTDIDSRVKNLEDIKAISWFKVIDLI